MNKKIILFVIASFAFFLAFGVMDVEANPSERGISVPNEDVESLREVVEELKSSGRGNVSLKANSNVTDTTLFSMSGDKLIFNYEAFSQASEKSKKDALGHFIKGIQNSSIGAQTQQRIIDEMSLQDKDVSRLLIPLVMDSTTADLYTAMKWLSPAIPIIRVLFGLGAIIIFILLMISTIVDLAAIGLPIARESLMQRAENSKSGKVPFLSSDAVSVIKETETALDSSGGYKNAYVIYFKRRALTYIILAICVLYLVVGELGGLISWVLNLGSGIVS